MSLLVFLTERRQIAAIRVSVVLARTRFMLYRGTLAELHGWPQTAVDLPPPVPIPRAHAWGLIPFTVIFYGANFFCKTAQFGETLREPAHLGLVRKNRLRNIAKTCAKSP